MRLAANHNSVLRPTGRQEAFSLIELLVVLVIMGLVAAISLPALKGVRQNNVMVSAGRQLVDHLSYARSRAIADNTTVYVVFIPPEILNQNLTLNGRDAKLFERLKGGMYTTYAIYAKRTVGEQPGRGRPRQILDWKSLPPGVIIETNKFVAPVTLADPVQRGLPFDIQFGFPTATNEVVVYNLPYLGFDNRGRLLPPNPADQNSALTGEVLPLARGSIIYVRDANGNIDPASVDVRETVPDNDGRHHVVIDGLTGRARVETQAIY